MKIRPNQVKKTSKTSLIGPRWMIQGKTRGPRQSTKHGMWEADDHGRSMAATACRWWLPRPWWPDFPRVVSFSSRHFVFPRDFLRFVLYFAFKRWSKAKCAVQGKAQNPMFRKRTSTTGQWLPRPACGGCHGLGGRIFPGLFCFLHDPSWPDLCCILPSKDIVFGLKKG